MTIQTGILDNEPMDGMHAKLIASMTLSDIHHLLQNSYCIDR